MNNKLEAIIFDLDGILTDTAEYHYKSWKIPLKKEGIKFTKKDNEKLRGLSRRDSIKTIVKEKKLNFSNKKEKEIMNKKNMFYQDFIKELDKNDMITGIFKILQTLKKRDYKLAVASASRNAKAVIDSLGLNDFFEVIADGNSVENSKPAPDLFYYTAKKINIKPQNCLVIEDSKAGIIGAQKAGMKVIGIGPYERIGLADFCYKKVTDIDLDEVLN